MEQFICKQLDEGYNAQLNSLFEEWLTFVGKEKEGVLLFNSFHPSARVQKWKIYEKVMSPFRHFLEQYKFDIVSAAHK